MTDATTTPDGNAPTPTLRERMRAAGLSDRRIAEHADAGAVLLDGEFITNLDQPAPAGSRWHFAGR